MRAETPPYVLKLLYANNVSVYAALPIRVAMPWSREAGGQRPALVGPWSGRPRE